MFEEEIEDANDVDPIYADCYEIITTARHELRAAPMMDLVSLALAFDYTPTLEEIYLNPLSDTNEECIRIEHIIIRCAVSLAGRLGVGLDHNEAYNKPKEVVRIIQGLTSEFETYEDTDTLYAILLSGEPEQYILENLIRYVYGDDNLFIEDLITNVEPRVLNVMRNYMTAEAEASSSATEVTQRQQRIVSYLRLFPENPSAFVFLNISSEADAESVAGALDFTVESRIGDADLLTIYTVGLAITFNEDFDTAYASLEKMLALINADEVPENLVLPRALTAIKAIYGSEIEDEEAGLSGSGV
ncbi:MAG: hypothetical protein ACRDBQ_18585 [Shewanella sp.]